MLFVFKKLELQWFIASITQSKNWIRYFKLCIKRWSLKFTIFSVKISLKWFFFQENLYMRLASRSVWRFWIWKIVHCIFFSQNFCKSFLLLFLCISTFLWNLQFLKLQKHSFRKITIYKNSRHTIQYYISWKKGTFDFINPHFTNSYHKNSSNSTDFH